MKGIVENIKTPVLGKANNSMIYFYSDAGLSR